MIFVTTGTTSFPFHRLVNEVVKNFSPKIHEDGIIQSGAYLMNSPVSHITIQPYFSYQEMVRLIKKARVVISAAGEASVFLILQHSENIPIVVPRLDKYHEHVDDQQLLIARFVRKMGWAKVAYNTHDLLRYLGAGGESRKLTAFSKKRNSLDAMISQLRDFTDAL